LLERGRLVPTEQELVSLSEVLEVMPPSALLKPVLVEPETATA
jgi:hypothetical protein